MATAAQAAWKTLQLCVLFTVQEILRLNSKAVLQFMEEHFGKF